MNLDVEHSIHFNNTANQKTFTRVGLGHVLDVGRPVDKNWTQVLVRMANLPDPGPGGTLDVFIDGETNELIIGVKSHAQHLLEASEEPRRRELERLQRVGELGQQLTRLDPVADQVQIGAIKVEIDELMAPAG